MTVLDDIVARKQADVAVLKREKGLSFFEDALAVFTAKGPSFSSALSKEGLQLIAEVKKASPSRGVIRHHFDPVALGETFYESGAGMLSVLTEPHFFKGDPGYILAIKDKTPLPVLRKDFILDPIQVYESKLIGADAILLIKAILDSDSCQELLLLANTLDLDVILEVHNEDELERISEMDGLAIIGINNRNLNTFEVDLETAGVLQQKIKSTMSESLLIIAESGYNNVAQLADLERRGFDAVLIGEGLAKTPDLLSYFKKV